jgi:hypothetical protein
LISPIFPPAPIPSQIWTLGSPKRLVYRKGSAHILSLATVPLIYFSLRAFYAIDYKEKNLVATKRNFEHEWKKVAKDIKMV